MALDGRRRARARAGAGHAQGPALDRRVRRPRRRRLRGVPEAIRPRPRGAVVEGLSRLAALRRRPHRPRADRFDRAFWVERAGGFYALALDGRKQPVDSRCSNMGHLLWSGIVPEARVADVARTLL